MMQAKHLLMRYTKTKMASLLDGYGLMTGTPENLLDARGSICIDEDSFVYVSVGCGWFVGECIDHSKENCQVYYIFKTDEIWCGIYNEDGQLHNRLVERREIARTVFTVDRRTR